MPDAADPGADGADRGWPEPLAGRRRRRPGRRSAGLPPPASAAVPALELPWTERGVVVCGDGCADPAALLRLAGEAGWPVLAEPSSGARAGPGALAAYPYLLGSPGFVAGHRPDVIVSAGRPGLSRAQLAYLKSAAPGGGAPGTWWSRRRRAAGRTRPGPPPTWPRRCGWRRAAPRPARTVPGGWRSWRAADAAARAAACAILDGDDTL